jgi:LuxR family maltose regulon positive regulatory protein
MTQGHAARVPGVRTDEAASSIAKLSAPRPVGTISRPRVAAEIAAALEAGIVWLAAPGGYGKTTAVTETVGHSGSPLKWYRVDTEDQDIARLFHYLTLSLGAAQAGMPMFGPEYAETPEDFARLFFRAYFSRLDPGTILVLDDLHRADTPSFRRTLAILLGERPHAIGVICVSRMLPEGDVAELALAGQMQVFNQSLLEFSAEEAQSLIAARARKPVTAGDISGARGWAVGLLMLANAGLHYRLPEAGSGFRETAADYFLHDIAPGDQVLLMKLNLLPDINSGLAEAFAGPQAARLLERLYHRQLLVTRDGPAGAAFQLHDLLREYLAALLDKRLAKAEQASLREQAAVVLHEAGKTDAAIALALQAGAWPLARRLILDSADAVLAEGRRATFIEWCARLPAGEMDGWIHHWLGVAHAFDDAMAEPHFSRAWQEFDGKDRRGQYLTVARSVTVKTASWRTHEGLEAWTRRAVELLAAPLPELGAQELTMVRLGMLRAINFAESSEANARNGRKLAKDIQQRLSRLPAEDPVALRLLASEALIDHAIALGDRQMFANAVDSVAEELDDPTLPPLLLGMWLVSFGAASGRYFPYSRRGFGYASAEEALRQAIAIAERHALKSVEFSALYHLQLLMKLRNDFSEFNALISRLGEIADSRFTTQVAVVADCQAALHTRQGDFARAYQDCDVFMEAIERANEPMVERWPHYVTKFQLLLADRRPHEAAELLEGILDRLDGGPRQRVELSMLAAQALEEKWAAEPYRTGGAAYDQRLGAFMAALRAANTPPVLVNLPELLSELVADALDRNIDTELCRQLVRGRRLTAPASRPAQWPWPLRIRLMGEFRIEADGAEVSFGAKPPTRALDILRIVCLSRDRVCAIETLQDWLWADLDGDQAKAACEQALHRLRKLLGQGDFIVLREGRIRLASDKVWLDLEEWEERLRRVLSARRESTIEEKEALLEGFAGPPFSNGPVPAWANAAADRVRDGVVELTERIGKYRQDLGDAARARRAYQRALDFYPDSAKLNSALIRESLSRNDHAGAIDDYQRYERALALTGEHQPSPSVRSLVRPLLA